MRYQAAFYFQSDFFQAGVEFFSWLRLVHGGVLTAVFRATVYALGSPPARTGTGTVSTFVHKCAECGGRVVLRIGKGVGDHARRGLPTAIDSHGIRYLE